MIVVDTSALFAIAAHEVERTRFLDVLDAAEDAMCSAVTYVETVMVLTGRSHRLATDHVVEMLRAFAVEVVPADQVVADAAVRAFDLFGKGRHPASLNLADCFSYALAHSRGAPLLYKGEDFAKTDIVAASPLR